MKIDTKKLTSVETSTPVKLLIVKNKNIPDTDEETASESEEETVEKTGRKKVLKLTLIGEEQMRSSRDIEKKKRNEGFVESEAELKEVCKNLFPDDVKDKKKEEPKSSHGILDLSRLLLGLKLDKKKSSKGERTISADRLVSKDTKEEMPVASPILGSVEKKHINYRTGRKGPVRRSARHL